MKAGTRIEVRGFDLANRERWEGAKIGQWHSSFQGEKGKAERPAGYHPVTFDRGGARLLVHESGFRVVGDKAEG